MMIPVQNNLQAWMMYWSKFLKVCVVCMTLHFPRFWKFTRQANLICTEAFHPAIYGWKISKKSHVTDILSHLDSRYMQPWNVVAPLVAVLFVMTIKHIVRCTVHTCYTSGLSCNWMIMLCSLAKYCDLRMPHTYCVLFKQIDVYSDITINRIRAISKCCWCN
jgi:hypothetical protein